MSTVVLVRGTRVMSFTSVDKRTTALRSGWKRGPNTPIHWDGQAKQTARGYAVLYYRQLLRNGYKPAA